MAQRKVGRKGRMGKEVGNERKIKEKEEILAPTFDMRKLDMVLLEMICFLRQDGYF